MSLYSFLLGAVVGVGVVVSLWVIDGLTSRRNRDRRREEESRPVCVVGGIRFPDPRDPRWVRKTRAPLSGVTYELGRVVVATGTSCSAGDGVQVHTEEGVVGYDDVAAKTYATAVHSYYLARMRPRVQATVDAFSGEE